MENPYEELETNDVPQKQQITRRQDLKHLYTEFFTDFRLHLTEFVRDNLVDTSIKEVLVAQEPIVLHNTPARAQLVIKNQGDNACFLTTNNLSGYRLDPGEKINLSVNKKVTAVTVSGNTSVGYIIS